MGTNYYLKGTGRCAACGRGPDEGLHIGKSSFGWAFALHVYPDGIDTSSGRTAPRDLEEWIPRFAEGIVDEYGNSVEPQQMIDIITKRDKYRASAPLRRHDVDGRFCIGHGEGSWDLMVGEFS